MAHHSSPPAAAFPSHRCPVPEEIGELSPELAALRDFVRGSREAFAVLTERYAGLVYSAAWRRSGSPELAEEVAQNVFAILARKAPLLLRANVPLAAWLHRAAVLEASQALRRETARQRTMKAFMIDQEISAQEPAAAPALESLLASLTLDR